MELNYQWATLLKKYVNQEISADELKELHRQMAASHFKQEQFDKVTTPDYFPNSLADLLKVDRQADSKIFREKLYRAIKNKKFISRLTNKNLRSLPIRS